MFLRGLLYYAVTFVEVACFEAYFPVKCLHQYNTHCINIYTAVLYCTVLWIGICEYIWICYFCCRCTIQSKWSQLTVRKTMVRTFWHFHLSSSLLWSCQTTLMFISSPMIILNWITKNKMPIQSDLVKHLNDIINGNVNLGKSCYSGRR